ncbi:hypothetical protein [Leptolyngbya sp. FACHB-16]|uniref:hypothetical protein n=1 Tax=unclassified Leptolyngbya TaxID=2650499 RepID=UPI0016872BC7|nr:hypothetical protein [Leptolyngbya sp. FACHB-16]MBD2153680.1 hypothetical protein [Leptolyngbya sp. FACHB-16]
MTGFNQARGERRHSNSSFSQPVNFAEARARGLDVSLESPSSEARTTEAIAARTLGQIRINFDQLRPFEVVDRQFQNHGVTFKNVIALIPSNPAFPARNGQTVLMGSPKSGLVEAQFERPVEYVAGFVTASSSAVMAAYDADGKPLAQDRISGANLAGSDSKIAPNAELRVRGQNIRRVTFQAFDGQLTLGEFCFG